MVIMYEQHNFTQLLMPVMPCIGLSSEWNNSDSFLLIADGGFSWFSFMVLEECLKIGQHRLFPNTSLLAIHFDVIIRCYHLELKEKRFVI
jgi:hypothetical protein